MRTCVLGLLLLAGCGAREIPDRSLDATPDTVTVDTLAIDTSGMPDTFVFDTAAADTGPDVDTGPPLRGPTAVTIVHASPDLGPRFVCLAALIGAPTALTAVQALGPIGVPDPASPTDPALFKPLPFGRVVPLPMSPTAVAAVKAFTTAFYFVEKNPLLEGKKCADVWPAAYADPTSFLLVPKGTITPDFNSTIVAATGCKSSPTADGPCGAAGAFPSLGVRLYQPNHLPLPSYAGVTGARVGLQVLHLSPHPTRQALDVYFQDPSPGVPVSLESTTGLSYGGLGASVGVRFPSKAGETADLTLVPHGAPFADPRALRVPLGPVFTTYSKIGASPLDGRDVVVVVLGPSAPHEVALAAAN